MPALGGEPAQQPRQLLHHTAVALVRACAMQAGVVRSRLALRHPPSHWEGSLQTPSLCSTWACTGPGGGGGGGWRASGTRESAQHGTTAGSAAHLLHAADLHEALRHGLAAGLLHQPDGLLHRRHVLCGGTTMDRCVPDCFGCPSVLLGKSSHRNRTCETLQLRIVFLECQRHDADPAGDGNPGMLAPMIGLLVQQTSSSV